MQSLRELYRIGFGPSSSHTIGVGLAAEYFYNLHETADKFKVVLYGSLAQTGVGHGTDQVLKETLKNKKVEIIFDTKTPESRLRHPNALDITAFKNNKVLGTIRFYSVGGGAVDCENCSKDAPQVYNLSKFTDIKKYCEQKNMRFYDYVFEVEPEIKDYLHIVWETMKECIENGIRANGILPGELKLKRQAGRVLKKCAASAYAIACAEENAGGGRIVTAPTCGACGVVPAVLRFAQEQHKYNDKQIVKALATAGVIGNLIKTNASISGAEAGCQAEIGSACSMAAAALAELAGCSLAQIETAAENAMEHFLGLTCDPVCGLVQIPCIERNAAAALRAMNAAQLAEVLGNRRIPFDTVVNIMFETGKDLQAAYRETSKGGLAKYYQ